jgi:hypothetical protein
MERAEKSEWKRRFLADCGVTLGEQTTSSLFFIFLVRGSFNFFFLFAYFSFCFCLFYFGPSFYSNLCPFPARQSCCSLASLLLLKGQRDDAFGGAFTHALVRSSSASDFGFRRREEEEEEGGTI